MTSRLGDAAEQDTNRRHAEIPEPNEYLSFLMGVDAITDANLTDVGVKILKRHGAAARELLVPSASVPSYTTMVRERLSRSSAHRLRAGPSCPTSVLPAER